LFLLWHALPQPLQAWDCCAIGMTGNHTPSVYIPCGWKRCTGKPSGRVRAAGWFWLSICSHSPDYFMNKSFHFSICSAHRLTVQDRMASSSRSACGQVPGVLTFSAPEDALRETSKKTQRCGCCAFFGSLYLYLCRSYSITDRWFARQIIVF